LKYSLRLFFPFVKPDQMLRFPVALRIGRELLTEGKAFCRAESTCSFTLGVPILPNTFFVHQPGRFFGDQEANLV